MAFGPQNKQPACRDYLGFFGGMFCLDPAAHFIGVDRGIGGQSLQHLHLDVAAKLNIGAAPGHVRGDGHRPELAGIGNDLGFLFVLTGVEHVMRHALFLQKIRKEFGLFDRGGADKDRLALFMRLLDRFHDAFELLARGAVHLVVVIDTGNRPVGRNFHNAKAVDLHEFLSLGGGCAGHAAQLVVKAEVILERDGGERDVLWLDRHSFLGLDRLMQPVRQAATAHHAAGEFVDQHHFAIAHDILLIAGEQLVRPQSLRDVMHQRGAFRVVKALAFRQQPRVQQPVFDEFVAVIGIGDVACLFIQLVVIFGQFRDQLVNGGVEIGPILRRTRDDQRCARLINQNTVHLIDDCVEMAALRHLFDRGFHVVAQIVKAQLVVRGIGDIGAVSLALLGIGLIGVDNPGRQTQSAVNLAHPFGIAFRQIVVHRDDMHTLARQGIQIGRKGRHQRLAFAGLHFGDIALMQKDAAFQLNVKSPQAKGTMCGLTAVGEGFGQKIVKALAFLGASGEFFRLGLDPLIGEGFEFRLQRVDLCDQRANRFYFAIIGGSKDFARNRSKTKHVFSVALSCHIRAS